MHPLALAVCVSLAASPGITQAVPSSASEGGPRRWVVVAPEVVVLAAPSKGGRIVGIFTRDSVLTNMGCEAQQDEIWCDVRSFRGGPRGYVPATALDAATGPDGTVPMGEDDSRRRAQAKNFDAEDRVDCAQEKGQALGICKAGVARGTGGDATVVATFSNGFARQLFFVHGEFVRASTTMSGAGHDVDWTLEEGSYHIRADDQRFVLPDSFVFRK